MSEVTPEEDRAKQNRADSKAAGIYLYSRSAAALLLVAAASMASYLYHDAGFAYVQAIFLIYETAIALGSLGLADAVFYFLGRKPERAAAIVRQTSGLLFAVAIPVTGAVAIGTHVMSEPDMNLLPALPWLALLLLLELPTQPAVNQLLAGGYTITASILFVGFALLRTGAVLVPALTGWAMTSIPATMAACGVLRLGVHLLILRRIYPLPRGDLWLVPRELREILAFALPAGMGATVGKLNPLLDKYVVGIMLGTEAFGVYSAAAYELPLVSLIPFAIGAVMQVRYVRLYAADQREDLRQLWYQTTQKTMLAVIPLAVLFVVLADELIVALFSADRADAATPFRIFTLVLLHRVAAYSPMLQAIGKTRVLMVTSSLILGTNLVLNVPLTWLIGYNGSAIATVIANVPAWMVCLHFIGRAWGGGVRDALPWRFYIRVLAVGAVAGVAAYALKESTGGILPVRIAVGAASLLVIYAALGRLVRVILPEDLAYVRRWFSFGVIK